MCSGEQYHEMCPEVVEKHNALDEALRDYLTLIAEHQFLEDPKQISNFYVEDCAVVGHLRPFIMMTQEADIYITEGFSINLPPHRINGLLEHGKLD